MILVCAFYAIAWLPEKSFIFLVGLGVYPNVLHNYLYYVAMFLGFLYIYANLTTIVIRRCLDVVS